MKKFYNLLPRDCKIDPAFSGLLGETLNRGPSPYDLVGGTLNPSSLID